MQPARPSCHNRPYATPPVPSTARPYFRPLLSPLREAMTEVGQHGFAELPRGGFAGYPAGRALALFGPVRQRLGDFEQVDPGLDDLLHERVRAPFLGTE